MSDQSQALPFPQEEAEDFSKLTQEEKLTKLLEINTKILENSSKTETHLYHIKVIIVVLIVLGVFAAIINACNAATYY